MAQHDMNIANQGFPATRADLNNALQALVSNSSGATAPSTTFANQWWYDTTNNKMYIRNEANNAWIEVFALDQTNNEWQLVTGQISAADGDGIAFKTDDATTRVTLDDSGNLLVGTTDNSLFNNGAGGNQGVMLGAAANIQIAKSGSAAMYLNRLDSDGEIQRFSKDGTPVGSIGTTGSRMFTGTGDTGLFFNDQVDSIDPWNTSTNAARDGLIDLGDGSRRFKDLYLSGGAYLGGTVAANKLDEYEEGTWTPATNVGSISAVRATYVKVGDFVFASANLADITETSSTTDIQISGLPFTSHNDQQATGSVMFRYLNAPTNAIQLTPLVGPTATLMTFYWSFNNAATWDGLRYADVGIGSPWDMIIGVGYRAQ